MLEVLSQQSQSTKEMIGKLDQINKALPNQISQQSNIKSKENYIKKGNKQNSNKKKDSATSENNRISFQIEPTVIDDNINHDSDSAVESDCSSVEIVNNSKKSSINNLNSHSKNNIINDKKKTKKSFKTLKKNQQQHYESNNDDDSESDHIVITNAINNNSRKQNKTN